MSWIRARTEEKKSERKEAIYNAALDLFKKNGYEKVSFNGIASEAGFTKSNMYRYFSSKEEIFLNIFSDLFEDWVDECVSQLKKLKQDVPAEKFAKAYLNSLTAHPHFLDLAPILFLSLERNSSFDQLFEFKKLAKHLLFQVSLEIIRVYPEMNGEWAFKLLSLCHAATCSYATQTVQNDVLKKIYKMDELKELRPNFEKEITSAIEVFVLGVKTKINQ
ncbi:MAG: TetR/AcrR family transcriptional regulator [Ignavibacteriae bacterium]|nr:TetR/AcrR family transcriptional regulator [Ignavibacteriota bacterium]